VRRGLVNVSIQVYLTAAVMSLKRIAAFLLIRSELIQCLSGCKEVIFYDFFNNLSVTTGSLPHCGYLSAILETIWTPQTTKSARLNPIPNSLLTVKIAVFYLS
jgi:hypothetical protein